MIVLPHSPPDLLNAYSTSPITRAMNQTLQHGIYDGTSARYGNPMYAVVVHDRPQFYGKSHYDLRITLDNEDMTDGFIIVDERTPASDAVWWIDNTEDCKATSDPAHYPAVRYPSEEFVLWQARLKTADLPMNIASWDVGCGDIQEGLLPFNGSYDPHDPQEDFYNSYIDWKDPKVQASYWGFVYIRADASEVEWSNNTNLTKTILPHPPVVVRLKKEAAQRVGLIPVWSGQPRISPPGEQISLIASYDWESPLWPRGYPDDLGRTGRKHALQPPSLPINVTHSLGTSAVTSTRMQLELRGKKCVGNRLRQGSLQHWFSAPNSIA